jgi:RHS repeat-associated protein
MVKLKVVGALRRLHACVKDMGTAFASHWWLGCLVGVLSAPPATAQDITLSNLQAQIPRATQNIVTLGADLVGDRVNLYNGALEFVHTDVSLPGNSALPVAFVRRHSVGRDPMVRGALADWEIETPSLGGNFGLAQGWVSSSGSTARCSQFSPPPMYVQSGVSFWAAEEFWHGHQLSIPGLPVQEVLRRTAANASAPADGFSWPLVTRDHWQIRCLPTVLNAAGEGFIAKSPEGVEYRFDWMATRRLPFLRDGSGASFQRTEMRLMATRVTDRFGNSVNYTYSASAPWLLSKIEASDGRRIDITYGTVLGASRVFSVSDGTRAWGYSYSSQGDLSSVTLPDGARWVLSLRSLVYPYPHHLGDSATCDFPGGWPSGELKGTVTHPSGATAEFSTDYRNHARSSVPRYCIQKVACTIPPGGGGGMAKIGGPATTAGSLTQRTPLTMRISGSAAAANQSSCISAAEYPRWQRDSTSQTLLAKSIIGPGLAPLKWTYNYPNQAGTWSPCTGCTGTKWVDVTDPRGIVTRHVFGNTFQVNDGQLLSVHEGWNGSTALRSTQYRYTASGSWPEPAGLSVAEHTDYVAARHRPQDQRMIQQDAVSFVRQVNSFDGRARPVHVTRSSSLGYSRSEATAYQDHLDKWVLGTVASVTETTTGLVPVARTFDPVTKRTATLSQFGRLVHTNIWNADGTLQQQRDGAGKTATLSDYHRGIARLMTFADGSTQRVNVNNLGAISTYTDELGITTSFGFDAMGRLNRVTYPLGDATTWADKTWRTEPVAVDEFGLAPGHWRQVESTGNARTVTYYDALWRPRLTSRYDVAGEAGTRSMVLRHFDDANRPTFESTAQRGIASVAAVPPGLATIYDGLGRPTGTRQDSELGVLTTSVAYLSGFQRRDTNARGFATQTAFQAFDEPNTDAPSTLWLPGDATVVFRRDVFGKARSITRSGSHAGGTLSVTRGFVYDQHQRLCKLLEPESGATVLEYDTANNLAWRGVGLQLPSTNTCDRGSVPGSYIISHVYDGRDRLISTTHGDGSPGISRSWWPDGKPRTISSGGTTWTLGFNLRRLPTTETLDVTGNSYAIGWDYDVHGGLRSITYPLGGPVVALNPNALGQPKQFGTLASSVTHHPNGMLAGYALANGVDFSSSLNLRSVPQALRHGILVHDLLSYDANANISAITDAAAGTSSRTMGYDPLDRLTSVAAPGIWGLATYGYDPLDNLRSSMVDNRVSTHGYDANNRLLGITGNTGTVAYAHDPRGNVVQRGGQIFRFDLANRLSAADGLAIHTYDGLGRRVRSVQTDGTVRTYVYSQAGQLMFSASTGGLGPARSTHHGYLNGKLFVELDSVKGTEFVQSDLLGSTVARSGAGGQLVSRTLHEPYGMTAAGAAPAGVGFTGHVSDASTGLVYMQQRYYDPVAGRFMSVDPMITEVTTGDHFSRYVYAANNPYSFKDPDGRAFETVWDIASFALSVKQFANAPSIGNAAGLVVDALAVAIPGVPGGIGALRAADKAIDSTSFFTTVIGRKSGSLRVSS